MIEAVDYLKGASHTNPIYGTQGLAILYERAVWHVSEAFGIEIKDDLPVRIKLKPDEYKFINDLEYEMVMARHDELNFNGLINFLDKHELLSKSNKEDEVNPEFLFFSVILKEGILPILKSDAFANEYKITKESVMDGVSELVTMFKRSNRPLFMFYAGEFTQILESYSKGKGLGWSNAVLLQARKIIRSI